MSPTNSRIHTPSSKTYCQDKRWYFLLVFMLTDIYHLPSTHETYNVLVCLFCTKPTRKRSFLIHKSGILVYPEGSLLYTYDMNLVCADKSNIDE